MIRKRRRTKSPATATQRVFSYLDGELSHEDGRAFESMLRDDLSLAEEVATYREVFAAVGSLRSFSPSPDFKVRVLAALATTPPAWARLKSWMLGAPVRGRSANALAASLDGSLSKRQARALAALVARNGEALAATREWEALFDRLSALPQLEPSAGFRDRVMARVRAEKTQDQAWARVTPLDKLRRLWPRRRERFAALSGVAFGPTAVVAATVYAILSNPLVTPSNLLSYLWAKSQGLVAAFGDALFGGVLENGAVGSAYALIRSLSVTGPTVAVGLVGFAGLTLMSGWILYRNVIKDSSMDRYYVAA